MERTTCVVVGGGPAGMVLGLLLARAGVEVTVLEKHADFLRDFRGDTVHASTVRLIDELGLGPGFRELPQSKLQTVGLPGPDGKPQVFGDISRLRKPYNYIAMVPQWDFLNFLASAAAKEPTFTLRMNTEVVGTVKEGGPNEEDNKVVGVRYRTTDGQEGELRADLTVACDGRGSLLRQESKLRPKEFPVPLDAWWFRMPRHEEEAGVVGGIRGAFGLAQIALLINREDYYQVAYLARKGLDPQLRAEGLAKFKARIVGLVPEFADRIDSLERMDDVKVLDVKLNRLRQWHTDGMLCIGDAAHAMSPIGGVGINLAVQDAVATATLLAGPLLERRLTTAHLASVRRRRRLPTIATQGMQRFLHSKVLAPVLSGKRSTYPTAPLLLMRIFPALRAVPAYLVAIGLRPEHAPDFARRDSYQFTV